MRIVSVPSEQGNLDKNKGCSKAPPLIIGDLECETAEIIAGDFEGTDKSIYKKARAVLSEGRALFVGGDHSISYPLVKAFSETAGGKRALVVFDAHPDCVQFFKPLSHEDWVQGVVEENFVEPKNVLLIGVRKTHELEREYLKKRGITVLSATEVKSAPKQALEKLLKLVALNNSIYVSVDIDAFDPNIAPGTGYLESNGLDETKFFVLFDALLKSKKVKAVDLVEVNPSKDKEGKTVELAQKILERAIQNWALD